MKRFLTSAVGIATLIILAISAQPTKAQVWLDFANIKSIPSETFTSIAGDLGTVNIPATEFSLQGKTAKEGRDDGYKRLDLGSFRYEYNGEVRNSLWICVNGFITFTQPAQTPAKFSQRLLEQGYNDPVNVVAPYWGDHFYGIGDDDNNGYKGSSIMYKFEDDCLVIEWKNLNINLQNVSVDGVVPAVISECYASFQLRLYKSTNPQTDQGDIEFAYGIIAGDPGATRLQDASIGIRGEVGDYLNGLCYENNPYAINPAFAKVSQQRTTFWQPSSASDYRIRFTAIQRYYLVDSWGDGDVDLSHAAIYPDNGKPQNQYVTPKDEKMILQSIVTGIALDPARKRQAYHGDVNHNGRYYFNEFGVRVNVPEKDMLFNDRINIPPYNALEKQIRFEVTEFDAALIMHYRTAGILELPWILDTIPQYGKVAQTTATGLTLGSASVVGVNTYRFPVYMNGTFFGPVGFTFASDAEVVNFENGLGYDNAINEFNTAKVAFATSGAFNAQTPVCYVTVKSNTGLVNLTSVRLNDIELPAMKNELVGVNENTNELNSLNITNNVVNNTLNAVANIEAAGNYQIEVVNILGNAVATFSQDMTNGINNIDINTYNFGAGMYILRVTGNNVSMNSKFIVK